MAEFSGDISLPTIQGLERPVGGVTTSTYLNASFDTGLAAGSNVVRWFTTGSADTTRASAPPPVGAYTDFWVDDIIT
jgi:hypothetical protein